jgi:methionyl-tRNA formyltransferase
MKKPTKNKYVVVGSRSWSRRIFKEVISSFPGRWYFASKPEKLSADWLEGIKPKYIFFVHWNWKVPEEIINKYECVCFHMTDVPYGRGGSPLQNLIIRGLRRTKLTALRMTHEFDSGPVYFKKDLGLEGNAEEIYLRASYLAAQMIKHIIRTNPSPVPQKGRVVVFRRRQPKDSEIKKMANLQKLYNLIRMLDAEGYPRAFINYRGFRYEFSNAVLDNEKIKACVKIIPLKEKNE